MANIDVVRDYFDTFFSGPARHSDVRAFITGDFTFRGPMMSADSADEYVEQLRAMGDEMELYAEVRELVASGDTVAVLVDVQGPTGTIPYAQWFTMQNGRIARLDVVYDPRPFLDAT